MRFSKMITMAVLLGLLALAAVTLLPADTAAYYEPPPDAAEEISKARLVADRLHGFAPMKVTLSAMLESRGGDLFPIAGGRAVMLVVESPFLHRSTTTGSHHIGTDYRYETVSQGHGEPAVYTRTVELTRPGRYIFRVQVLDDAGAVLESNEVTVKAM